jgi:hypothetical protein
VRCEAAHFATLALYYFTDQHSLDCQPRRRMKQLGRNRFEPLTPPVDGGRIPAHRINPSRYADNLHGRTAAAHNLPPLSSDKSAALKRWWNRVVIL